VSYERDYYAILQISRNASQDEIERAYARLSKAYDPLTSQKRRAAQRHAEVLEAYETLKDPRSRRQYDRRSAASRASAGGMLPADVISRRFVFLSGGVIVVSIGVILAMVLLLGGNGDEEALVVDTGTPTPTPEGQTPKPTPPSTPPEITAPFTTTESGLQIATIQEGTGATPQAGETVNVEYTGWLQGGGLFDSSFNPGRESFSFPLGQGRVIKAWDEGVALMKIGGTYRIIAPPDLAYGEQGSGTTIPPNSTLIFDISVLGVGSSTPTPTAQPLPTATTTTAP
jgi:peptidylprolyl isomerase